IPERTRRGSLKCCGIEPLLCSWIGDMPVPNQIGTVLVFTSVAGVRRNRWIERLPRSGLDDAVNFPTGNQHSRRAVKTGTERMPLSNWNLINGTQREPVPVVVIRKSSSAADNV